MMAWKQYILSAPSDGCMFSSYFVACVYTLIQLLVTKYEVVMSTLSMNVSATNSVLIINEHDMMHDKLVVCLKRVIGNRK